MSNKIFFLSKNINSSAPWFDVPASFRRDYIVPDVVPYTPFEPVFVKYNSSVEARLGNRLYTPDIATAPSVFWQADPHAYYTLVMTGKRLGFKIPLSKCLKEKD